METSSHNLATPWRFRDGTEYLVSLGLHENPKSMSLLLSDKITAEEWTGDFDVKYIENLTQRTGNYKPFDTFHAMIKSAILKKSGAVALDLMSYEDLLALRSQKKRMGQASVTSINDFLLGQNLANNSGGSGNENPESQSGPANWQESTTMAGPKPKKYIIITYIAEFDKVHYPLPLKYTGYPDASVMQQTIHKLKNEVDQLKFTNTELFAQLKSLLKSNNGRNFPSSTKSRINKSQGRTGSGSRSRPHRRPFGKNANPQMDASLSDPGSEVEAEADVDDTERDEDGEEVQRDMNADIDTMRFSQSNKKSNKYKYQNQNGNGSSFESIQSLGSMVQRLESLIEDERVSHMGKISKLEKENDYLRCQLKSVENSESLLKDKVGRLESVLAMNVGLTKRKSSNLKEVYRSPYGRERSRTLTPNPSSTHRSLLSKTKIRSQNDENVRPSNKVPVPSSRRCKQNSRVPCSRNISTSRSRDSSIASGCIYKGNRNEQERGAHQKIHNAHYVGQISRTVSASGRSRSRDGNKPAFNPTEYVKQKRIKQESMAQLRLARVESRLKNNKSRQKLLAEDHGNFRKIHPSEEAVSVDVDRRRRSSSLRSTTTFTTGNSNLDSNARQSMLDPGKKEINYGRRLSVESGQHSVKGTCNPSIHSRRISPSPSRPKTSVMETSERRSRNKIRDHNTLSKNKKVGRMSIHEILESARKDYNRKDEAKQKQDKMLFNTKKSETYRSWKIEPMSNADSIYDGLERRLNTIHTFLEKNHNQKSKG